MSEQNKSIKVKYLHGRPSAHYTHANFAKQVGADFEFVDFKYRWQDQQKNIFYIIYSWFYCAKNYTNRKLYDLFLVDGLHFPPVIMKFLFLKRKRQKIVTYLGSHTMYFLYAGKFGKVNTWLHKKALRSYDAVICEGEMARFFVTEVLKKNIPPLYTVFNGIPAAQNLSNIEKQVGFGKRLLFMGSYDSQFRFEYKGIDIMLEAFAIAFAKDNAITFTLVGRPDTVLLNKELDKLNPAARQAVNIVDYTSDLAGVLFEHDLYLHCSRGDNFPTTVLIALSAGMPSVVNELNGTRKVVAEVHPKLVATHDATAIAQAILWYLQLAEKEKKVLMQKAREVSERYTEEKAVQRFTTVFEEIKRDLLPAK